MTTLATPLVKPATGHRDPMRAVLMGCGVVGGGVLETCPDGVRIEAILARTARPGGVRGIRVFTNPDALFALNPDLVIEALPGCDLAEQVLERAVDAGCHVVTANKRTAARRPDLVRALGLKGARFACSSAVGGGAPVLETAEQLVRSGQPIARVRGVLNGTSNFVLDRLAAGERLADAVAAAQAAGFAEADPSADLDGLDAAHKLVLIARASWGVDLDPDAIKTESISNLPEGAARQVRRSDGVLRQIGQLSRSATGITASVRLEALAIDDPLARTRNEGNAVLFTPQFGAATLVTGKGAGRVPTAASLVGDLERLCQELSQ
jgi:homoserine dehydrogenase